jgi:rhamnosyltransferase
MQVPYSDVFVVVVTFHPAEDLLANLAALRPQVGTVIVVDNGSSAEELVWLRAGTTSIGFELIENGENFGIATGLNVGIRRAMQLAGERMSEAWVLLFDQDSRVTDGFTAAMLAGFASSRWGDRLGLLAPHYRDKRFGSPLTPDRTPDGALAVAMTSGSLLRMATLHGHGLFADELFIDSVDHEYCLRLRAAGYVIDECLDAILLHSPGDPTLFRFRGKVRFQAANYSPVRRYYQERNKIWMYRRYFRRFPGYCTRLFVVSIKDFAKIVLVETGKLLKIRFFLCGVLDGLRERMGRCPL